MPSGPVAIRFRHVRRMLADVIGHWHHNRVRWPVVTAVVFVVVLGLLVL